MKFFLAILLACTYASAHPGAERVKRQSASSGSASSYAGSSNGGQGFAFSGGSGLPFGDLFSSFPGFDQGGFNNYNAYSANMFPQSGQFGYGDYNGIGSYNNGYYTGGYNRAGFNGGTNGLGGFSGGYNGNGYYNNYPTYPRYAPSYDQTSSSSFANSPADVGLFSRISPVAPIYAGPGVSSSYSSSSSNGNGGGITFTESNVDGVRSGSTTQVDPSGRVTSYQHGTGVQDTLSTRMLQPGQASGIYSASGVTNNNGNVSAFRAGGAIN